jgi:hypothetical protein
MALLDTLREAREEEVTAKAAFDEHNATSRPTAERAKKTWGNKKKRLEDALVAVRERIQDLERSM